MMRLQVSLGVVMLLLVSGCASTPVPNLYTIDMTPSGRTNPVANIDVDRLLLFEPLERRDILIKKTATQIEYYAQARWAGRLDEMVRQKLEAEFGPNRQGERVVVSGMLLAFEQVDLANGAEAYVKMELEFHMPDAHDESSRYHGREPALRKVYEARRTADVSRPGAVVEALSRALEDIATAIAADADAL